MKKKFIFIVTAIMLCLCFTFFAACNQSQNNNSDPAGTGGGSEGTYYTVTFDSQGGSAVESQQVLAGNPARVPSSPSKTNFDFGGWFRSADENAEMWNFSSDCVNENLTLYAHWTAKRETPEETATLTYLSVADGFEVTGDDGDSPNIVIPAEHSGRPVVSIAESAFAYSRHNADIISVTIPDSVTEIGQNAFYNQDALLSVNIGENSGLEKIGSNAFSGCSALTRFYLPAGCTSLGYDADEPHYTVTDSDYIDSLGEVFNACAALQNFEVADGNTAFESMGGHLVYVGGGHGTAEAKILVRGVNSSEIPEGVTEIGKAAFRGAAVETIYIPASVTKIGNYFADGSAIASVYYAGSSAAWDNVNKPRMWNFNAEFTVNCDAAFPAAANS